jgi:hypothetical protein
MTKREKPDDAALPVEEDTRYVWRWTLNECDGEYTANMFDTVTGDVEQVFFNHHTNKWARVNGTGYESEGDSGE